MGKRGINIFLGQYKVFEMVKLKAMDCYERLLYYLSFYINFLMSDLGFDLDL